MGEMVAKLGDRVLYDVIPILQKGARPTHPTLNTQHSTLDTRHSTLDTQRSTLNTQHSTLNTEH